MNYDTQLLLLLAIGAIGMAGWIVAIWQYMRAEDAVSETSVAELERNLIRSQHADLVHVLAFPPYGHQPRDAQGRFARPKDNRALNMTATERARLQAGQFETNAYLREITWLQR